MNPEEFTAALEKKFDGLQKNYESIQAELKKAQENGASKEEVLKLHGSIKKQGQALEDLQEQLKNKKIENVLTCFKDFVDDNIDKINEIQKNKSGSITFKYVDNNIDKAVGPMGLGSGSNIDSAPAVMHNNLGNFNLRNDNDLMSLMTVTSTNSPAIGYTEMLPKEGDYSFVAEGGDKPQVDFKWENRFVTPKKAAAYEVLSTEVEQDVPGMVTRAREYLLKKHDLFKVGKLFFGTGLLEEPEGATVIGRVFSAGPLALQVSNVNFMDTVNAAITDIYTTQNFADEEPYRANLVMINPVDFYIQLVSAKDANGLPLYPQAGLFNQVNIGGVTIKPWVKIPSGKIFVADMTKYNLVNYIPFEITIGWINNQLITNQFTMVGESRFYAYVKQLDRQAFLYDDIATIKTAIEKV